MPSSVHPSPRLSSGFTLIEVLVALALLAIMAVMSWRGIDTLSRGIAQTRERADHLLGVQAGLNQWATDLDGAETMSNVGGLDWNGRTLRLIRRDADGAAHVVAWTQRTSSTGRGQWLRWQSVALWRLEDVRTAWQDAALWSQNPTGSLRQREVMVANLDNWQLFYYRGNSWTNPLSSAGTTSTSSTTTSTSTTGSTSDSTTTLPDGVRLVLDLPADSPLPGRVIRDWVRPTLGGSSS